jgi:hypothetical protein
LRCVCGTRCVALQLMRVGGWMQVSPKQFVQRLKHDNELFRSFMHQDAHEFLNFLLNDCCETLERKHSVRAPQKTKPAYPRNHDAAMDGLIASPSELIASPSKLLTSPSELLASPSELLASPSEL